eukprot:2381065-Karenia_brevis.AAC.1
MHAPHVNDLEHARKWWPSATDDLLQVQSRAPRAQLIIMCDAKSRPPSYIAGCVGDYGRHAVTYTIPLFEKVAFQ